MSTARPPLLARLGEQVRARRQGLTLTLRELASRAGVSERFLIGVELGTANVSVLRLADIAEALETDPASLLRGGDAPDRRPPAPRGGVVCLLGLRGAGKSTIGRLSAQELGRPFHELDALVAERAGMSGGEIFELHGQAYYRRLEREELRQLLSSGIPAVVATTGSIVTDHESLELVRGAAVTVWLKARPQDHMRRVMAQGDARPMANRPDAMKELTALLRARRALYERAHHVVDTSVLGLERSVERVVKIARTAERDSAQAR